MILSRFAYTPTDTQGRLIIGDWSCFTIERPWIRSDHRGGTPFESCIPDGIYSVAPFIRPNGDMALSIVNPELGVYLNEHDRPEDSAGNRHGRYLCLIHSANFADEVVGCIAPGRRRRNADRGVMVTQSRDTMAEIIELGSSHNRLEIRQAPGALDAPLR